MSIPKQGRHLFPKDAMKMSEFDKERLAPSRRQQAIDEGKADNGSLGPMKRKTFFKIQGQRML